MSKPNFGHGMLTAFFIAGILWFFAGRLILEPIMATTEAVRTEVESAQSYGNNVTKGHIGMERTIAKLIKRSETIETGSASIVTRSKELTEGSKVLEGGLENISNSVRAGEKRYGLIVGVVGELRDITETFRETIENTTLEN